MSDSFKNIAVILAGGIGERMQASMPKQLMKIAGKSIIDHTLSTIQTNKEIDEIIVLMNPGYMDTIKVITDKYDKITAVLPGGKTRNDTSEIAIDYLLTKYEDCNVLFHDAVRPFISDRIVHDCIVALDKYSAVDVAIPSSDTIIEVNNKDEIVNIPDRSTLRRGQTPQAFKLTTIHEAYVHAKKDKGFKATDDCGVVLKYLPKVPIFVVDGDENNMKVTQPVDAFIADKLFQISSRDNVKLSDVDREKMLQDKTIVIFGGSYGIGKEVADIGKKYNANVYCFSRSLNNVNVTDNDSVKSALETVHKGTGRIDYVVNTAGELTISHLEDLSDEEIQKATDINYLAPIYLARNSYKYLKETKGSIILFTSSSYTRGRSDYSLYSSAKAATVNFTQALAEEWFDSGVSINCINPERTATPMRTKAFGDEPKDTLLDPKKVAEVTIDTLLGSLTGQVVDVRRG